MSYFRNDAWKEDLQLKEDLQKYVGQLFKRTAAQRGHAAILKAAAIF